MKLDKTLEEITTYNKSLNNTTGEVSEKYFKLRLDNDKKLSLLSSTHNDLKNKERSIIANLNLISLKRIDYFIKNSKKNVKDECDIQTTANYAFSKMLEDFSHNNSIYYINNKDTIINYMTQIYKLNLEKKKFMLELNGILNEFITVNNIKSHVLAVLVTSYQELKRELKVCADFNNNLEEYLKYRNIKDDISTFVEKVFLEEVQNNRNKDILNKICSDNNNKKDLEHSLESAKYYAPKDEETVSKPNKSQEVNMVLDVFRNSKEIDDSITTLSNVEQKLEIKPKRKRKTKAEMKIFNEKQRLCLNVLAPIANLIKN